MIRPPFPGAYWFAAAILLGIVRIIANMAHLDGVFLIVFILAAIGFWRFVTRIPIPEKRPEDDREA